MFKSIFQHQHISRYLYPCLCGMAGALIVCAFFNFQNRTAIATVNITGMTRGFLTETAQQNLSFEQKQQKINQFGQILQKSLDEIAKSKHLTVLPSEAVLSGAPDITREIMARIKKGFK